MNEFDSEDPTSLLDIVEVNATEVDDGGNVLWITAGLLRLAGIDPARRAEVLARGLDGLRDLLTIVDVGGVRRGDPTEATARAMRERVEVRERVGVLGQDGEVTWVEVVATPRAATREGGSRSVVVTVHDVGDRMRAERDAAEQGALLAAVVRRSEDFVVVSRPDGQVRFVSPSVTERMGWTREDLQADREMSTTHPDDLPRLRAAWQSLLDGSRKQFHTSHRARTRDGEWLHVEGTVTSYVGEPPIDAIVSHVRDVTALDAAHVELERAHELTSAILNTSSDLMTVFNADQTVRMHSDAVQQVLGYTAEERVGSDTFALLHPDDTDTVGRAIRRLLEEPEQPQRFIARMRHRDGSWRTLDVVGRNLLGRAPIDGILTFSRDITDIRAVESERDQLGRRMQTMFESIDDLLFEAIEAPDGSVEVVYTSPNYWRVSGRSTGDRSQFGNWADTVIEEDLAAYRRFHEELVEEGAAATLVRSDDPELGRRWVLVRATRAPEPGGGARLLYMVSDVTEQHEREEELARLSRLLDAAVSHMHAEMMIVDDSGRVLLINDRLRAAVERDGRRLEPGDTMVDASRAWAEQMLEPDAEFARILDLMHATDPVIGDQVRMRDGTVHERDVIPIAMDDDVVWRLWVTRDVTATIRAAEQLEQARRAAEVSSRHKTQFLATMSHEIRTPLNGVIGMLELLAFEPDAASRAHMLDTVRGSADALLAIINDVLEISQIEEGRVEVDCRPFDVRALGREVCELFAPLADRKGVGLETHIDDQLADGLEGDPVRIRQVLVNLIDNAVRHTRDGSIEICIEPSAVPMPDDLVGVRFAVRDTGSGVSPEVRSQLFDPFVQPPDNDRPSTGLGLSICSRLVKLMGGSIECRSTVGVGSTFEFTLPLRRALVGASVGEGRPAGPRGYRDAPELVLAIAVDEHAPNLLVVEDNDVNREILTRQLDRLGYRWEAVDNGDDALAALAEGGFDGVLMDCQMRGLDGYDTTRRIRSLAMQSVRGGDIPVLAVTASAFDEDRARCLGAGMDDVLAKPVRLEELRTMVQRHVPREGRGEHPAGADTARRIAHGSLDVIVDRGAIDDLRADLADDGIVVRSLGIYLGQLGRRAAAITDAIRGDSVDIDAVERGAHELKSTSSTFGAVGLAAACNRLEQAARAGDTESVQVVGPQLPGLVEQTRQVLAQVAEELRRGANG